MGPRWAEALKNRFRKKSGGRMLHRPPTRHRASPQRPCASPEKTSRAAPSASKAPCASPANSPRARRCPSWTAHEPPAARSQQLLHAGSLARPLDAPVSIPHRPAPRPRACLVPRTWWLDRPVPRSTAPQNHAGSQARHHPPPIESPIRASCRRFSSTDLIRDHARAAPSNTERSRMRSSSLGSGAST